VVLDNQHVCSIISGPVRIAPDIETIAITAAKLAGAESDALLQALKTCKPGSDGQLQAAQVLVKALTSLLPEAAFRKDASTQLAVMRQLLDYSTTLGTQLELRPLAVTTVTFCVQQLKLQDAAIWFDDVRLRYVSDAQRGATCEEMERRLFAQCVGNNSVVHLPDARKDFMFKDVRGAEAIASTIYAVPVRIDRKAEGMIVFYAPRSSLDEGHKQLLDGIAARLSMSLERARSLNDARTSAVTDPLTGLFNKRYLLDTLKNELQRAREFGRPTAMLILDIDNFKTYNDSFGHPAGDSLLKAIGQLLLQHAGTINVPCRYGGEEFVVIMPETNVEIAHLTAERIRQAIAARSDAHRPTTASFGVAVSLKSDVPSERVLTESDKALYHSKKTGKNRTTTTVIVDAKLNPVSYDVAK
jgi:diguanylate cyclase (GGDEF)-like protein